MKTVIKFSKLFIPCIVLSILLMIFSIVGLFYKGINFGLDFQAGFIEKVRVAPTAFTLSYDGPKTVNVSLSSNGLDIISTAVDGESQAISFMYRDYATVGDFFEKLKDFEGLTVSLIKANSSTPFENLFIDSQVLPRLSPTPFKFHYLPSDIEVIDTDNVRHALSELPSASVQQVGKAIDRVFQIRIADDGKNENANVELRKLITDALNKEFGEDNIVVMSTDFVGSMFSTSLARQAVQLVLGALVLIFIYAMFRFRWDFALGGILALLHDTLAIFAFIVWTQMEFNSISIAAVLTIIGYSINDTVVIYDRIRENIMLHPKDVCTDILDISLSEVLGRTIITTLTTMLAALSLYIFTEGSMKDFAMCLIVGMLSGTYSSIYIASACINFFCRNKKGEEMFISKANPAGVSV
ncbi:MAG: protein translocase subunit SecF [Treponema sp.]